MVAVRNEAHNEESIDEIVVSICGTVAPRDGSVK